VRDLFFSEYIEGSATNKEHWNVAAGWTTAYSVKLEATVPPPPRSSAADRLSALRQDCWCAGQQQLDAFITAGSIAADNTVVNFNGDDAVTLEKKPAW
jgi:hypothetical protein